MATNRITGAVPGPRATLRSMPHRSVLPVSLKGDTFRLALFFAVIVTVSRVQLHFGMLASLRPAALLVLIALAYAFFTPRTLNRNILRTWPAKALAALGIIACISVPFGISIGNSGKFILESYSKVLLFGFLLIAAIRNYRELSVFVWAYVLSCGILVWFSISVFSLVGGRLDNLYGYDANDLGVVLMVGLPLALLTFQTSGRKGRLVSGLVILGIGIALARSGSRGGFLGFLAVGAALFLLANQVPLQKRLAFLAAVVLALGLAAPTGYWEQMETILNPTEDYNWEAETGRRKVAERGIGYMVSRPLTGLGVNNFGRAEGTISEMAMDRDRGREKGVRWVAAHNSFVQIGAETGFPGLIVYCILVFGGVVAMLRLRRRIPRHWARGDHEERFLFFAAQYLPVSLIGFAVTAFFVSFAYMDIIYILAAFMAGLYVSVDIKRRCDGVSATVPAGVPRSRLPFPRPSPSLLGR